MAKLVTIFGGSGFVGRQIARIMAQRGWRVRVAVRRPNEALFVRCYGSVGQVEPFGCNIRDDLSVAAAMADADAVINCVGILVNEGRNRFDPVQHEGAARIAQLAADRGVAQLVHISAIGADAESDSAYAASKGKGEAGVLAHFPEAVILRPSVIFGEGDGLYTRFAAMAGFGPVVALPGGKTRMQPVFVEDVATAAVMGAEGRAAPGLYELGGPDVLTLRQIVEQVCASIGKRRLILNLPMWIGAIVATGLDVGSWLTGGLFTNRIVTRDQIRLLRDDNVVSGDAPGLADLGIAPTSAESVIDDYLWRFRTGGQYAAMTASARNLRQG